MGRALDAFERRNGFIAARGVAIEETRFSAAFVRDFDYYTGFVFEARDPGCPDAKTALSGGRYDGLAQAPRRDRRHSRRRRRDHARPAADGGERLMALAFADTRPKRRSCWRSPRRGDCRRARRRFSPAPGSSSCRDAARATIEARSIGLPGVEVAYVSSAEIVSQLAAGAAHFGVAGEDLVREKVQDVEARLELLSPLGFGHANVVVAAPRAWIDVRSMADLDDVASAYRAERGERMRVATKYVNLTRRFFAEHGVADYRIVESLGATEGAPASGAAELIVDITTTGATLAANALKALDDGVILRSQATLVASLAAPWGPHARAIGARHSRPNRRDRGGPAIAGGPRAAAEPGSSRRGDGLRAVRAVSAAGEDVDPHGFVALHCARAKVAELAGWLFAKGAERVSVIALEQVFDAVNPLYEALEKRIGPGQA